MVSRPEIENIIGKKAAIDIPLGTVLTFEMINVQ